MGWSEYQYYTSSPYMFFAACEGYFDRLDDQAALFRSLAGIVNRSMGGKAEMQQVWPLHSDPKPEKIKPFSEEELKEITSRHQEIFKRLNRK